MNRRELIGLLGSAALSWPVAARAQQKRKMPLLGMLTPGAADGPGAAGFYKGLQEFGYVEGGNIAIERRYGDWKPERFGEIAADLVRMEVDVIVVASTSPARAVRDVTRTIPIVVAGMADPVGDELVASLSRPGGNLTGTTFLGPDLIAKRLGLLKDAIAGLSRVAALLHPGAYGRRTMDGILRETEAAAATLGLALQLAPSEQPADLEAAFAAMGRDRAEAFVQLPSPMLFAENRRIAEFAAARRIPGIYAAREFVLNGGLMSYGASQFDLFRRAAFYVDRILKGASPADLPVEQPTKLEFVVNLKAARALGLSLPGGLISLAEEVIE